MSDRHPNPTPLDSDFLVALYTRTGFVPQANGRKTLPPRHFLTREGLATRVEADNLGVGVAGPSVRATASRTAASRQGRSPEQERRLK